MDMTIQAAQKSPKDHSSKWVKPQNEELKKLEIQTPSAPKDKRLNSIRKPRGHKEEKGLLSQSISVQESQKSINKVLVLEKKEKNRKKGGRGRPGEESGGVGLLGSRGR